MAAHGNLNTVSFFWKDGGNSNLTKAKHAMNYLKNVNSPQNAKEQTNYDYIHDLISQEISGTLEDLRTKSNWVIAYKVDISAGSVMWNGASWKPDVDEGGFLTSMTKADRKQLKDFAVERLTKNPRFLAVPGIYTGENNWECKYTLKWIQDTIGNKHNIESCFDKNDESYYISPFEWFRTIEHHIRKQVYKFGFTRDESKTITVINNLPIHSDEYQSAPILQLNTYLGFSHNTTNHTKSAKSIPKKVNRKITLSSSSSSSGQASTTASSTATSTSTSTSGSPSNRKMYMNLDKCTSMSQLFIGAFVNSMYGGKSSDSQTEHSDARKALKAFSQFKIDHYSDKGTQPFMTDVGTLEYMHYWLMQHTSEYNPSLMKTPFVNADCACEHTQKTCTQEIETQSPSATSEWDGYHITHPYNRFISLYMHHHTTSENYSDKVVLRENQVFKDAVKSWREKTDVVINGVSQKWRPTVANVDSWFGMENSDNNCDTESINSDEYEHMGDVD